MMDLAARRFLGRISPAFTLIELLVVVGIIVVLIAILVPSLGRARETARTTHCASGLRQWGLAVACYMNDYEQFLPQEGATNSATAVTDPAAWFNALPLYVNAPRYCYMYAGVNVRVGTTIADESNRTWTIGAPAGDGGYKNTWIWYCQTRLIKTKNSGSALNSFHYAWNAVLNGSNSFGPSFSTSPANVDHIKTTNVTEPMNTPILFETDNNSPAESPAAGDVNIARQRHKNTSLNILFLDTRVETLPGDDVPVPTGSSTGSQATWNGQQWSSNERRRLIWGPYRH